MNNIPECNLNDPNTKPNKQSIKFDLFDFSGDEPKRISLDMMYDPNDPAMMVPPDGLKLTITTGDNIGSSSCTIPMQMLTQAVGQLLANHKQQKNSGLVGINPMPLVDANGKKLN